MHGVVIPHARKTVEAEHITELDIATVLLLQEGEVNVLDSHRKPHPVELTDVMVCIWYLVI